MMERFIVRASRHDEVAIDRETFSGFFEDIAPYVTDYAVYSRAIQIGGISLKELKRLALKADIPFALFFAPPQIIRKQVNDFKKELDKKFPSKKEMALNGRGPIRLADVQPIVRDLARKQEFLKKYVLSSAPENKYVGFLTKKIKREGLRAEAVAGVFREHFDVDLGIVRSIPGKEAALEYFRDKAEGRNIFISFSSHNYMPQRLAKNLRFSGFCVKDKKFPYIFINTRDGDEEPLILESAGRQTLTLMSMLVSIGLGIFAINTRSKDRKVIDNRSRQIFSIAEAVLIPRADLSDVRVAKVEELDAWADHFKVTPSMLLTRMLKLRRIEEEFADKLRLELQERIKGASNRRNAPLQTTGFGKYNGKRFSREVVGAYADGKVTYDQAVNVLFRKGKKVHGDLFQEYSRIFAR